MPHAKNIVIIGPAYPLRGGGMATFNERLARAFMAEGHAVRIDTFSLQYPSFLFPGTSQYSTETAPEGLNIRVIINSINPLNWWKVGNSLKKEKPDLIVVRYWLPLMGPCFGTILRIAKKNGHSKIVCIADNVIPHEKRFGDKPFTKYFIKPIDAFITMSDQVLKDLRFFTKAPASFVPHPIYDNFGEKVSMAIARQNLNIESNAFVLLFFGFIRDYKGLDILLESLNKVRNSIPKIKLIVAGEFYGSSNAFDKQVAALNLQPLLLQHTHFIADNSIKNYFCAADVVVQPYREATQSGVTPLAYHFETPMIVTNVGGLPSLVPDGKVGLVAEPEADSIAEKIILFYQLGAASFKLALLEEKKKYSWPVMVKEILDLARLPDG